MQAITITDDDITEAEAAILGEGEEFNDEQRAFIKCLETIDLTACPGSGKTTALVAKLYILAKYEVWNKGMPICVISHTRIAMEEIREKVASHFPRIMDYPNFIGTIQEFIDRYLAIPYYKSLGLGEIKSIDNEIFANKWMSMPTRKVLFRLVNVGPLQSIDEYRTKVSNLAYDYSAEIRLSPAEIFLSTTQVPTYDQALNAKDELFRQGYLTYADTLMLARKYLERYPKLNQALLRRFSYIFLDEAQDTSSEQMRILDCFDDAFCYQRIGDPLQTIYNSDHEGEDAWVVRTGDQYKTLARTNRFGSAIASLVNAIGNSITNDVSMSSDNERPYQECILVLFDDEAPQTALEWFETFVEEELAFLGEEKVIYAVGAVGKEKEGRLTLNSYSPSYRRDVSSRGKYFRHPRDYFADFTPELILAEGSNMVHDRLMKLLTTSLKSMDDSLISRDIKERVVNESEPIAKLVSKITKNVVRGGPVPYSGISEILRAEALRLFGVDNLSIDFQHVEAAIQEFDDVEPVDTTTTMSTIHGIKGQTHDATLLVSTQYYDLGRSKKSGEIGGTDVDYLVKDSSRSEKRRKLLYVAASRPRYLFAWAIPKSKRQKASAIEGMFTRTIEL